MRSRLKTTVASNLSWRTLAAIVLTTGGGVAAQEADTPVSTDADAPITLDAVSVYATRNPIAAFDYPGQVTVVERDIVLDFNPSTLQEVFQAVPGAQFDSGPRRTGDAPTVRGLTGKAC